MSLPFLWFERLPFRVWGLLLWRESRALLGLAFLRWNSSKDMQDSIFDRRNLLSTMSCQLRRFRKKDSKVCSCRFLIWRGQILFYFCKNSFHWVRSSSPLYYTDPLYRTLFPANTAQRVVSALSLRSERPRSFEREAANERETHGLWLKKARD